MLKKNKELEAVNQNFQAICESLNDDTDKAFDNEVQVDDVRKNLVLMNKNTSGHLYVTCDQRFQTNAHLEKHMDLIILSRVLHV